LLAERYLDVNTLSASLAGLATYGLAGLWMAPHRWRRGLPAALLIVGVLPFGEHMETFLGYPMRIWTAALVRDGLQAAGYPSIGLDTILVFENGISQVDLPCSGVKSLWTGGLFLLAAAWIEARPLNWRWWVSAVALVLLLFAANLVRVGALTAVGQVAGWRLAAEMLHVPLGVLGFTTACGAAWWLLRRNPAPNPGNPSEAQVECPVWLGPALAIAILVMGLAYTPRPAEVHSSAAPADWIFPAELATEPDPLSAEEWEWLARGGAEAVERRRFTWRGHSGVLLLISSHTWRAHHRPERCFEVYGLAVEDARTHLIRPDFSLRFANLHFEDAPPSASAAYWFQSDSRATDDYGTRIWADLAPRRQRWVLVTVLFEGRTDPADPDLQALFESLHVAVQRGLADGGS